MYLQPFDLPLALECPESLDDLIKRNVGVCSRIEEQVDVGAVSVVPSRGEDTSLTHLIAVAADPGVKGLHEPVETFLEVCGDVQPGVGHWLQP